MLVHVVDIQGFKTALGGTPGVAQVRHLEKSKMDAKIHTLLSRVLQMIERSFQCLEYGFRGQGIQIK